MTYEEIRTESVLKFYNPYCDLCEAVVNGMMERLETKPITLDEQFALYWNWAKSLEREAEIRPLMEECKVLIG